MHGSNQADVQRSEPQDEHNNTLQTALRSKHEDMQYSQQARANEHIKLNVTK